MSVPIITVENLSKSYLVGHQSGQGDTTLRDFVTRTAREFTRKAAEMARGQQIIQGDEVEEFWALKDVSFEVKHGEVFGIIGRNGAGKSTLLKILSRITEPTEGRIVLRGRVASLLEVGTGFHAELSGRENIYLNGAILGMTKQEIRRKFDEIVAFAEVERFIDTPVKRYSSGMYVRLAFAVAAHLEPEILIVDEVLAVGDAAFQKKCLGKMEGIANQGRTIFFVSHNMGAVLSLCSKALLLESGSIQSIGQPRDVVQKYMETAQTFGIVPLDQRDDRAGDGTARVTSIQIESTAPDKIVRSTSSLKVTLSYKSAMPLVNAKFLVGIYDYRNTGIFLLNSEETGSLPAVLPPEGSLTCTTGPINLTPGSCFANVAIIKAGDMADHVQYAAQIHVEEGDFHGTGKVPARERALCVLKYEWSVLS